MSILSVAQARSYAAKAGFTGNSLNVIVAISQAESGLNTAATGKNTDGSIDRGIVQINNKYHSEVLDSCAYDPLCAYGAAYKISNLGTNFSAWSTYTNGAYKKYISSTSVNLPGGKQWWNYPVTHGYITNYQGIGTDTPHYALDLGTPYETPFYFPKSGTIKTADYQSWGGQIFETPDDGTPVEYGYHFDQVLVKPGSHVVAGQVVGYTGGQTSGGHHPTSSQWSTGPHLHFGYWTNWTNSPLGSIAYGPNPQTLLDQLKAGTINFGGAATDTTPSTTTNSNSAYVSVSEKAHEILNEFPGFTGIAVALDELEQFPGVIWYPNDNPLDIGTTVANSIRSVIDTSLSNTTPAIFRGLLMFIGIIIIVGLVYNAVSSVASNVAPSLQAIAPLIAAA